MIKQIQMCVTTAAAVRSFHSKKGKKSTGCFFVQQVQIIQRWSSAPPAADRWPLEMRQLGDQIAVTSASGSGRGGGEAPLIGQQDRKYNHRLSFSSSPLCVSVCICSVSSIQTPGSVSNLSLSESSLLGMEWDDWLRVGRPQTVTSCLSVLIQKVKSPWVVLHPQSGSIRSPP